MGLIFSRDPSPDRAAMFVRRGDLRSALREYLRLVEENPRDWNLANTLGDLYIQMGSIDEAVPFLTRAAEQLASDGFFAKARAVYRKVLRLQPLDTAVRERFTELENQSGVHSSPFLRRVLESARPAPEPAQASADAPSATRCDSRSDGFRVGSKPPLLESAAPHRSAAELVLVPAAAPPPSIDPSLAPLLSATASEAWLDPGEPDARHALRHLDSDGWAEPQDVEGRPSRAAEMSTAGHDEGDEVGEEWVPIDLTPVLAEPDCAIANAGELPSEVEPHSGDPDAAAQSESDAAGADFREAVSTLEEFLSDHPHDVDALDRLIEVAVDGGLERQLPSVQARLAEACIVAGLNERARNIAIDLVERYPDVAAYRELSARVDETAQPVQGPEPAAAEEGASMVAPAATPALLDSIAATAHEDRDTAVAATPRSGVQPAPLPAAARRPAPLTAEEQLAQSDRFIEQRDFDAAIQMLDRAACAPHLRCDVSCRRAQIHLERGAPLEALACLEWAAEGPPPSDESGHELAYHLGLTLEALGQREQALGVYRELLSEVGPLYHDTSSRIARLS